MTLIKLISKTALDHREARYFIGNSNKQILVKEAFVEL